MGEDHKPSHRLQCLPRLVQCHPQGINPGLPAHGNMASVSLHPPQISWGAADFAQGESCWECSPHAHPCPPCLPSSCLLQGQRGHACALLHSFGTVLAMGTALTVLTDKCTGRCCTPTEDPQKAGTRTYLTGSCMVCSHDQQWEKRWNMLSSSAWRDGVSLAPTKRAARRVPVLRPPAYAFSPWRGASHPWVPRPTTHHCCLQPGTHKPSLGTNPSPPGNTPWARTPWPAPALAAPSCIARVPISLSPASSCLAAPAHIPFA